MKNEQQLIEAIVTMIDAQLGERSHTAQLIAWDIASAARDTDNPALARVFTKVANHYSY